MSPLARRRALAVLVVAAIAVSIVPAADALTVDVAGVRVEIEGVDDPTKDPPQPDPTKPAGTCLRSAGWGGEHSTVRPGDVVKTCGTAVGDWTLAQACEDGAGWARRVAPSDLDPLLRQARSQLPEEGSSGAGCVADDLPRELPRSTAPSIVPVLAVDEPADVGLRRSHTTRPQLADRGLGVHGSPEPGRVPQDGTAPRVALLILALAIPAAVALHRRLSRESLLDNDLRRRVVDLLEARPGLTAGRVATEIDVQDSTARYHLRLLEEFGVVESRRPRSRTRYYVRGKMTKTAKRIAGQLTSDTRRRIAACLARDGASSPSELARRLDVAKSTVAYHLGRLQDAGVVERRPVGGRVRYRVPDAVGAELAALAEDADAA